MWWAVGSTEVEYLSGCETKDMGDGRDGGGEPQNYLQGSRWETSSCLTLSLTPALNSESWVCFLAPLLADCVFGHCLSLLGLRSS